MKHFKTLLFCLTPILIIFLQSSYSLAQQEQDSTPAHASVPGIFFWPADHDSPISFRLDGFSVYGGLQNAFDDSMAFSRALFDFGIYSKYNISIISRLSGNLLLNGWNLQANGTEIPGKNNTSWGQLDKLISNYSNSNKYTPFTVSLGRNPAENNQSKDVTAYNTDRQSLPHAINWQIDGLAIGLDFSKITSIKGLQLTLIYGEGYDNDLKYIRFLESSLTQDDVNFLGYIARFFDNGTTKVSHMYAHAFDVTDGFDGLVAMPFAITGVDSNHDGIYDAYFIDANRGGYISGFEATANIGSMDLANISLSSELFGVKYFIDLAGSYCRPDGISKIPMMQFMGTDSLLNSNGEQKNRAGYSIWAGINVPVAVTNGTLGLEFNWGSQYWLSFNKVSDSFVINKLSTRGKVYELYYRQPLFNSKLEVSLGVQHYDYEYIGSGTPLGKPIKIGNLSPWDTLLPVINKGEELYYMTLNYKW